MSLKKLSLVFLAFALAFSPGCKLTYLSLRPNDSLLIHYQRRDIPRGHLKQIIESVDQADSKGVK